MLGPSHSNAPFLDLDLGGPVESVWGDSRVGIENFIPGLSTWVACASIPGLSIWMACAIWEVSPSDTYNYPSL
jgi:hypothetical protein